MKFKLPMGVCVLISLALVVFGFAFGTVRGYSDDRRQVTALLEGENGLLDVLSYRGADGLNLCVVAGRHLPGDDEDLLALNAAAKKLQAADEALDEKKEEDERLTAAVAAVSRKLNASESFRASERDQKYLDMLTTDLKNLTASEVVGTYNQAALDFNAQLDTPIVGMIARLLGVAYCPLYE